MRAFFVEMLVLAMLILTLALGSHFISDHWRATHVGVYGYFALYGLVTTQLTYFLVAYTATF